MSDQAPEALERTCRSHPSNFPDPTCGSCRQRPGWLRILVQARREWAQRQRERDPSWMPEPAPEDRPRTRSS